MTVGSLRMAGSVGLQIVKRDAWVPEPIAALTRAFNPRSELGLYIKTLLRYLPADAAAELIERVSRTTILESALRIVHIDRSRGLPVHHDYGIASRKLVTTAGVGFLVDAWQNLVEMENMKFHGIGTGGTAEASGDTALVTESTTALNPDNTRATGTLAEGAANIFSTVGTLTADGTIAATEHGLFSQAATGGGVLWDRSLFTVVNLASADSIQTTYSLTASAGG